MELLPKQENMTLAHWIYTQEEWNTFLRYKKRKNGFWAYLVHFLFIGFKRKAPVVKITPGMISIGEESRHFNDTRYSVRKVDLSDEGGINILAISFQNRSDRKEIRVPVPRGKLREAIEIQERFSQTV